MSSFQEQMGQQMTQVAGAVVELLPPGCGAAQLVAKANVEGNDVTLSIRIVDPSTEQPLVPPTPSVTQAVANLYRVFADNGQAFASIRLTVTEEADGNWDIDLQISHEEEARLNPDDLLEDMGGGDLDLGNMDLGNMDLENMDLENMDLGEPDSNPLGTPATSAPAPPKFDGSHMSDAFRKLLATHCALSTEKSRLLDELKAGKNWNLDLKAQTLTFGDDLSCHIDIMGSWSESSQTWLWAWANKASSFPDAAVAKSRQVKATGKKNDIWEFTEAKIELHRLHVDYLARVLCGLCQADFFYWARYEGGAALVVGKCDAIGEGLADDLARVTTVIGEALQMAGEHVDHLKMVAAYLREKGYRGKQSDAQLRTTSPDGQSLTIEFDELRRLTRMSTG